MVIKDLSKSLGSHQNPFCIKESKDFNDVTENNFVEIVGQTEFYYKKSSNSKEFYTLMENGSLILSKKYLLNRVLIPFESRTIHKRDNAEEYEAFRNKINSIKSKDGN